MAEAAVITSKKSEAPPSMETPRNTVLVQLPPINDRVRLGMHTDSIGTLLKALHRASETNPELLDQLKIEGRILTGTQEAQLESSPIYQFYMRGRVTREQFILPDSLLFAPEKITILLQESFSPSSLKGEVGHKAGYFSARELVDQWLSDGMVNRLLPVLGGINEFRIGSDTLTPERLAEVSGLLFQAFIDQEASKSQQPLAASSLAGFKFYSLSNLNLINKNNSEFILKKTNLHDDSYNKTIIKTPIQFMKNLKEIPKNKF